MDWQGNHFSIGVGEESASLLNRKKNRRSVSSKWKSLYRVVSEGKNVFAKHKV